jgi:hypothetical protein
MKQVKNIIFRILPPLIVMTAIFSSISCGDPFSDIDLPILPEALDVERGFSKKLNAKYLVYRLNRRFPAMDVIDFYNEKFKDAHLIRYSEDGHGIGQWVDFNPTTGKWENTDKPPARYIATWVDIEKENRIVLGLRYKYDGADAAKGKKTLIVDLKATNFFDLRELENQIKKKMGSKLK